MLSWLRRWRAGRAQRAAGGASATTARGANGRSGSDDEADDREADDRESDGRDANGRNTGDPDAELTEGEDGDAEAVDASLTDELDLHTFLPKECADVVEEYVRAAQEAGFATVRIIHGKGTGAMRRTVHAVLQRHPAVQNFQLADARRGSWGATLVELKPLAAPPTRTGSAE